MPFGIRDLVLLGVLTVYGCRQGLTVPTDAGNPASPDLLGLVGVSPDLANDATRGADVVPDAPWKGDAAAPDGTSGQADLVSPDASADQPKRDGIGEVARDMAPDANLLAQDAGLSDAGRADATEAGGGNSEAGALIPPRITPACAAPLPTGFCLVGDPADHSGGTYISVSGDTAVVLSSSTSTYVRFTLSSGASQWYADFQANPGVRLGPGLFDPAQRYPFQAGSNAGLHVSENGRSCDMLYGRFSVEELARDPASGIKRMSVTFEQHCENVDAALRGVINYQAFGVSEPTPAPDRTIPFKGEIVRIAYDAAAHVAYGLDAANRRLARIDLTTGDALYADVAQVPNDVCVDVKRKRLFAVNKGSSLLSEYNTGDLSWVRDIPWTGTDWGPSDTHFKIYCAADTLYVVDADWEPALFTVTALDTASPKVTDQSASVAGVGGLVINRPATDLYYWYQSEWDETTNVFRLNSADFSKKDEAGTNVPLFARDPNDAPILLDETRGLILVKNKIFDSTNLAKVLATLPGKFDSSEGAAENVYALDSAHGLFASKSFVYELSSFSPVAEPLVPAAAQSFFDRDGVLWMISLAAGALEGQIIRR
jgi:hypothetical protein